MPLWGADLSTINFDDIYYYLKPTNKEGKNWEDVPLEIKKLLTNWEFPRQNKKLYPGLRPNLTVRLFTGQSKNAFR